MKLELDEGQVFLDGVPIAQMASLNVATSKDASCEISKFNMPASVSVTGKASFNQEIVTKLINEMVERQVYVQKQAKLSAYDISLFDHEGSIKSEDVIIKDIAHVWISLENNPQKNRHKQNIANIVAGVKDAHKFKMLMDDLTRKERKKCT